MQVIIDRILSSTTEYLGGPYLVDANMGIEYL